MPYTRRPFNYTGTLPNQVQNDLELADDNFDILAQAFVNNDPASGVAKNADMVDGFHASQTPTANTIPVAGSTGKLDAGWLPELASDKNFYVVEFSSSGTWTVPSGVTKIIVIAVGGGGGGGGGGTSAGGEGGYPGNSTVVLLTVSPGETLTITIGAGGAGGAPTGGNGGDTVITGSVSGNLLPVPGGIGGRQGISGSSYGLPGMSSFFGRGGQGGAAGQGGSDAPRPGAGGGGGGSGGNIGGNGGSGFVRIIYLA